MDSPRMPFVVLVAFFVVFVVFVVDAFPSRHTFRVSRQAGGD